MPERIDVFVIGGGTAGTAAARALARGGKSVVVAEQDRLGGTCLWRGCIPKKALAHAASVVRETRCAEEFGISPGDVTVDWPSVLAWKWHAQETYAGDQDGILSGLGVERIMSAAALTNPDTVVAGGREFKPSHIIVAVGSRPVTLDVPGGELADSSDEALRYPTLPASAVIVGGGYIAMEFAGILASFGTAVTVVNRSDHLLAPFDPDCVAIARTQLEALGVAFVAGAHVLRIDGTPGALTLVYTASDGTERSVAAERVLAAIGRRPAFDGLGLHVADIETDERGRPLLDGTLRSSNPRVYFAGDAALHEQHTPVAHVHGVTVAESILGTVPVAPDTTGIPFACFTVPELAQVGLTLHAAETSGLTGEVHSATFEYLGAAIIADVRHGLVKVIAEKNTGRILGAHIAGERASDLIQPYALAVRLGASLDDMRHSAAVHPAFAEAVNWAAF